MFMYTCKQCDCTWGVEESGGKPRICPKCRAMTEVDEGFHQLIEDQKTTTEEKE